MAYISIPLEKSYSLLNSGPVVLIATKGRYYNLAPIAWNCTVDYEPVVKVLFVSDSDHQTAINAKEKQEFAVCIPHVSQKRIVEKCGTVSDADIDKYTKFGILHAERPAEPASGIDIKAPDGCVGWIECTLERVIAEGSVELFIGTAKAAFAEESAWNGTQLDYTTEAGQPLQYLGDGIFGSVKPL